MKRSLRSLLSQILDYAGLFPPAKLSLTDSVHEYNQLRTHAQSEYLSRFILPIAQASDFFAVARIEVDSSVCWKLSVLSKAGDDEASALAQLEVDVEVLGNVFSRSENVAVDCLEFVLPPKVFEAADVAKTVSFLSRVESALQMLRLPQRVTPRVFLEMPYRNKHDAFAKGVKAVAEFNEKYDQNWAAKIRTGSTIAAEVPSISDVSFALCAIAKENIAFKCTAGLHDALRHLDLSLNVDFHGFLNMWTAALLAKKDPSNAKNVAAVLEEKNGAHFQFSDEGLRFKEFEFSNSEIENSRKNFAISFGSCSFLEPIQSLVTLKLL